MMGWEKYSRRELTTPRVARLTPVAADEGVRSVLREIWSMEKSESMVVCEAILATDAYIEKYERALSKDLLEQFAEQLRGTFVLIPIEHDRTRVMPAYVMEAGVRRSSNGESWELWAQYAMAEEDFKLAGDRRGISIAFTEPLAGPPDAQMMISAEALSFSSEDLAELLNLSADVDLRVCRLYQYGDATELARIALEFSLPVLQSVMASGIWDAITWLAHRKRGGGRTVIEARVIDVDPVLGTPRTTEVIVSTDDGQVVREAMKLLFDSDRDLGRQYVYDPEREELLP